ncbi:hypothetical protein SAMN05421749_103296 [Acinetobacter marinus]|uniref:GcrA cell cycle regulator n=1 Tax=Acinetobacter marinus TaxID=281375 RepID=A0A1G6JAT2_9GAMM|nr:hypothetical protein [Acinetobacter marinus]SDC15848.1 hypothetical protein SAMN05421749_103296 [Acinetobacter marinus]
MADWYTQEVKILKQMYLDGYGAKRIAETLGTTRIRVERKITSLGLRKLWRTEAPKRKRLKSSLDQHMTESAFKIDCDIVCHPSMNDVCKIKDYTTTGEARIYSASALWGKKHIFVVPAHELRKATEHEQATGFRIDD